VTGSDVFISSYSRPGKNAVLSDDPAFTHLAVWGGATWVNDTVNACEERSFRGTIEVS
jgi:hypothetical protein